GNTIQRYVEPPGFNVVRDLCGHGIGKEIHEDPQILNYGKRRKGPEIKEGMVFCLEPMITVGGYKLKKSKDGFGYETADGSLSAHFEHTIALTKKGCQVLTDLKQ
ncbi:M24 family metallopeptidase, partial [Patescibacteria group bacterium]|nr:M24 family metallopeptidase [Patescibacteria group bacterium]